MQSSKFLTVLWCLSSALLTWGLLVGPVAALDDQAILQCHQLHNANADPNSVYINSDCQLNCYIGGKLFAHALNEGTRCPQASTDLFICRGGGCVERIFYGHVNLEIHLATLSAPATAYATACLINATETVHFPIRDRSRCVDCLTAISPSSANPVWNSVCAKMNGLIFSSQSTLALEVWDHLDRLNNQFVGGASMPIPQLPTHQFTDQELVTPLSGGKSTGSIKTHFSWSPIVA